MLNWELCWQYRTFLCCMYVQCKKKRNSRDILLCKQKKNLTESWNPDNKLVYVHHTVSLATRHFKVRIDGWVSKQRNDSVYQTNQSDGILKYILKIPFQVGVIMSHWVCFTRDRLHKIRIQKSLFFFTPPIRFANQHTTLCG